MKLSKKYYERSMKVIKNFLKYEKNEFIRKWKILYKFYESYQNFMKLLKNYIKDLWRILYWKNFTKLSKTFVKSIEFCEDLLSVKYHEKTIQKDI